MSSFSLFSTNKSPFIIFHIKDSLNVTQKQLLFFSYILGHGQADADDYDNDDNDGT